MNVRLLQISDSALPISGYTHSWGLEAAISAGRVAGPEALEGWARRWLRTSLGPLEGVLCAAACRAALADDADDLVALNEVAEASVVPPSVRKAAREMGDQFLALAATWGWAAGGVARLTRAAPAGPHGWHHAVVFGLVGAVAGGTPEEVVTAYLHQATVGVVSAGVRAIPVGHTHGQQVMAYLHDDIAAVAADVLAREPETAGAGCPSYEVLCDEQTRLYARMFRS